MDLYLWLPKNNNMRNRKNNLFRLTWFYRYPKKKKKKSNNMSNRKKQP